MFADELEPKRSSDYPTISLLQLHLSSARSPCGPKHLKRRQLSYSHFLPYMQNKRQICALNGQGSLKVMLKDPDWDIITEEQGERVRARESMWHLSMAYQPSYLIESRILISMHLLRGWSIGRGEAMLTWLPTMLHWQTCRNPFTPFDSDLRLREASSRRKDEYVHCVCLAG